MTIFSLTEQGYSDQIALLQAQLDSLPEGAERDYLTGVLLVFKREQAIEEAHPELDPTTKAGADALQKLFQKDGDLQKIEHATSFFLLISCWLYLLGLIDSAPTSWGFTSVGMLGKPGDVTVFHENI
jgi:hypothetical protein